MKARGGLKISAHSPKKETPVSPFPLDQQNIGVIREAEDYYTNFKLSTGNN